MSEFDIIIAGAGPAGSMAAISASKAGRKVCLLERKARAGVPVRCGEGIGRRGLLDHIEPNLNGSATLLKSCYDLSIRHSYRTERNQ